ncbi:MAG TPA: hypothetical protein VKY85_14195 [Candidatus Angelobacter sp.]|nr:hypothetical protein [Candidatus Angelobacter sp.]
MPKPPAKPASPAKPKPANVAKPATSVAKPFSRVTMPRFVPATKTAKPPVKLATPVTSHPVNTVRPVTTKPGPVTTKPGTVTTKPGIVTTKPGTTTTPGKTTPTPVNVGHAGPATAPARVPPTVLNTVAVAHPQVTPPVNSIRFIDPNFARNIVNLRPPAEGVTRDQIKVPICPAPDVTDEVLFEDPAQPAKKFYLPRYKVVTDHQKYQISFQQNDTGWSFVVNLTKFPAPSVATAASSAQELDHHVAVLVRFSQMIGTQAGAQEELPFQEVTLKGGVLNATLRLDSLQQRDLLYQALSDRTFGTALIVRRAVTVAVQAPVPRPPINIMFRMGGAPQPAPTPSAPLYRQVDRAVDQAVDPKPFVFSPELHKEIFAGVIPSSTGGGLELTRYQVPGSDGQNYTYYQDGARPYVFYYLPNSFKIARRPDGAHEPLISVSFGQAASAEDLKATFSFIAVPYVDPKRLQAAADKLKASITQPLPKGVDGPQFEPLLSAPGKIHFSLSYPGCDTSKGPFELREKASVDLRSGIHDSVQLPLPQFQTLYDALFSPSSLLLTGKVDVELGSDSGEEIPFSARLNDLAGDFLTYTDQPLTDGTAPAVDGSGDPGSDAPSMKDSVTSAIGDAVTGDVQAAVGDIVGGLAGKLFHKGKKDNKKDKKKKGQPSAPPPPPELGVQATLQNIIESPIEIQALDATLVRGQESLPANIDGLDLSQPVQIPPGQQITFNVIPATPVAASSPVHAQYDLSGVHPVPDRDAIWNETLDPTAAESYLTTITVKTPASTFAVPAADATQQIVSLVVDFDSGVSVELNSAKLEAKVDLPHPVVNYVLRKTDAGEYRYKVTRVHAGGDQTRDDDWRPPETTTVLFPAVR